MVTSEQQTRGQPGSSFCPGDHQVSRNDCFSAPSALRGLGGSLLVSLCGRMRGRRGFHLKHDFPQVAQLRPCEALWLRQRPQRLPQHGAAGGRGGRACVWMDRNQPGLLVANPLVNTSAGGRGQVALQAAGKPGWPEPLVPGARSRLLSTRPQASCMGQPCPVGCSVASGPVMQPTWFLASPEDGHLAAAWPLPASCAGSAGRGLSSPAGIGIHHFRAGWLSR